MTNEEYQDELMKARRLVTDATFRYCKSSPARLKNQTIGTWEFVVMHALDEMAETVE